MKTKRRGKETPSWNISSSEQVLSEIRTGAISETDAARFETIVICEVENIKKDCPINIRRAQVVASETKDKVQLELDQKVLKHAEAEHNLKALPDPSLIRFLLSKGGFITCFLAEFALTYLTLPFLFDLKQNSFLALMLSLAPATGLIVLDVIVERFIGQSGQALRADANLPAWQKRAHIAGMTLFFVVMAFLNVYMVLLLAGVREESVHLQEVLLQSSFETEPPQVDRNLLRKAVIVLSLTITMDAALFLVVGLEHWRRLRTYWKARALVFKLRSEQVALESELIQIKEDIAALEILSSEGEERGRHLAGIHRADKLMKFYRKARQLQPKASPKPITEVVEGILAGYPEARPLRF